MLDNWCPYDDRVNPSRMISHEKPPCPDKTEHHKLSSAPRKTKLNSAPTKTNHPCPEQAAWGSFFFPLEHTQSQGFYTLGRPKASVMRFLLPHLGTVLVCQHKAPPSLLSHTLLNSNRRERSSENQKSQKVQQPLQLPTATSRKNKKNVPTTPSTCVCGRWACPAASPRSRP